MEGWVREKTLHRLRGGKGKWLWLWGRCWLQCQLVGGGPTCHWLSQFPSSMWWGKQQMGVWRFCPCPGSGSSVQLLQYAVLGEHGVHGWSPVPAIVTRVNTLHRGIGPASFSYKHSAAPQWIWGKATLPFNSKQSGCPLKVSQAMPNMKRSRPETRGKLIFHLRIERDRRRCAKLDVLYILTHFLYHPRGVLWMHIDVCDVRDRMIRGRMWWEAEVKGLCQELKAPKSITGWLGDLYVSTFVIDQCARSLKAQSELIRDALRSEPPTPLVRPDLLITLFYFFCNVTQGTPKRKVHSNKEGAERETSNRSHYISSLRPHICSLLSLCGLINPPLLGVLPESALIFVLVGIH